MPRFFFDLYAARIITDEEGQECADLDAARSEALRSARELASEDVLAGHLDLSHHFQVFDAERRQILTVGYWEAVAVSNDRYPTAAGAPASTIVGGARR